MTELVYNFQVTFWECDKDPIQKILNEL